MLKIVSINIETDRHYDRVIPFIKKHQPDVVLMQEVFENDINFIENALNMKGTFTVLNTYSNVENSTLGILSLSLLPLLKKENRYYRGESDTIPQIRKGFAEAANINRMLLLTEYLKDNQKFCLINTHFTWTPDGLPSEKQYEDIEKMLQHLSNIDEFVLCGDFNAPRGGPIFKKIAEKYQDNIPISITSTIDKDLHKAGDLNLVVDGLFTTPRYIVNSVEIVSGVSDHCAIVATINLNR